MVCVILGLTSWEIIIVSTFGSVLFIVLAGLAAILFMKHSKSNKNCSSFFWVHCLQLFRILILLRLSPGAGRKPNILDGSDEEKIEPYATVRLSRIFPLNDESDGLDNKN